MALACVNVDLDSIGHYLRIHGLDERALSDETRHLVYRAAIERFLALFARFGVPATFFAIGEDLADEPSAANLRAAAKAGHEVGNHTFGHPYALTRLSAEDMAAEVARGEEAIAQAVGKRPAGFRAPGYTLTGPLFELLVARGYRYDSSVYPAAPYYAAKALVMGVQYAFGRRTRAILDDPRVLLAPRLPYRPNPAEPYRRGASATLELPVSVGPVTRMPFIGTTATLMPRPVVAGLYRELRRQPFVNFELHGIDLLDASDVNVPALERVQPDLRLHAARKAERLAEIVGWLTDDFEVVTLEDAARRL